MPRPRYTIRKLRKIPRCMAAVVFLMFVEPEVPAEEMADLKAGAEGFNRGDFTEAKRRFEKALAADAKNSEARLYLGRIALEEQRYRDGMHQLELASKECPTNAVYVLWLARGYGLQAKEAGIPGGLGPALKSKAAFEKAVALDPDLIEAREDLLQFHLEAPGIIGGSRRMARAQANEIKKRDPYVGLLVQGDLLLDERKFREAERIYQSAAEMKPAKPDAYYRLGRLCLETKEFGKASSSFENILQLDTNEVAACYYIGQTGALSGQGLPRAEEALKRYLLTRPRFYKPSLAAAHFCLGQIYERKGDRDLARAEFQRALKLEPDHKEAKASLRKLRSGP
ncbi:MAG: tetratricopeptide repeat protein [Verrucomicrobia bacterium]|nr:tetratricopeptide repeat protein [Verrucomicrobiota bacterium]